MSAESNDSSLPPGPASPEGTGQVVLYRTGDGQTRVQVRLVRDSAWLNLNQIADLFQRDKSVISKHVKNIFDEREIDPAGTVAKFATVQTESDSLFFNQEELIFPDLVWTEQIRRFAKMLGKLGDASNIGGDGVGCVIPDLEILQHPLS